MINNLYKSQPDLNDDIYIMQLVVANKGNQKA